MTTDFRRDTTHYESIINALTAKVEYPEGWRLPRVVNELADAVHFQSPLEMEAIRAFWRSLGLMKLARAVERATSPHSLVVNGVMNKAALFLFEGERGDYEFAATAEEIGAAIGVTPSVVESGLGHLKFFEAVEEEEGRWKLHSSLDY